MDIHGEPVHLRSVMEVVMIPAKTVVTINGVPVALAVDTLVEVEYANMCYLTGYHYAHLPEAPMRFMPC